MTHIYNWSKLFVSRSSGCIQERIFFIKNKKQMQVLNTINNSQRQFWFAVLIHAILPRKNSGKKINEDEKQEEERGRNSRMRCVVIRHSFVHAIIFTITGRWRKNNSHAPSYCQKSDFPLQTYRSLYQGFKVLFYLILWFQSAGAVWKSRWPSWVPVPNKLLWT